MTGILNALIAGVSGAVKDAYFNLVSLLLPGNGTDGKQNRTFKDSSVNDFLITPNGNATQGTFSPFSQTGWGNYFNGSSYLLSTATQVIPAGSFTVEAWAYPTVSTDGYIVAQGTTGNAARFSVGIESNAWYVQIGATRVSSSAAPVINKWTYIAVTFNGSTLTLYVDGQSVGTPASTSTNAQNTTLRVGSLGPADWAALYWTGYISSVRISNTVRSISIPTTPTPFTADANTTFLGCNINRFQYTTSAGGFTSLTAGGSPSVVPFSPFAPTQSYSAAAVGGSGYFDGTGDYLTAADNAAFTLGTSDFTIEAWVYALSSGTTDRYFIAHADNATAAGSSFALYIFSGNSKIYFECYVSTTTTVITSDSAIVLNQWNHVAICRSSGTLAMFVNGTRQASPASIGSSSINNCANSVSVGARTTGGSTYTGYLSSSRMVVGTDVYGAGNSTITVPTAPLTAITNTQLLLNFTNAGITDATAKNVLETVGNAQISTTQSKWGGGSISFDGSTSRLQIPDVPLFSLGSEDFTIEGWVYTGSSGQQTIAFIGGNTSFYGLRFEINGGGSRRLQCLISKTSTTIDLNYTATTGGLSLNTWTHVALVRNGSNVYLYENGSQVGTTQTLTGAVYDGPLNQIGVCSTVNYMSGYIDDLRISKVARYTGSTYTAPTAPFPLQ